MYTLFVRVAMILKINTKIIDKTFSLEYNEKTFRA